MCCHFQVWCNDDQIHNAFIMVTVSCGRMTLIYPCNAWSPPFRCLAVTVCKFRKNYVSAVRITLLAWKIPLHRCRSHLPLCCNCRSVANRIESYFCHSAVDGQPISILVTSSLCIRKDVSSNSVLTGNGNGSHGTEERHNGMAMAKRQWQNGNGVVETRHKTIQMANTLSSAFHTYSGDKQFTVGVGVWSKRRQAITATDQNGDKNA